MAGPPQPARPSPTQRPTVPVWLLLLAPALTLVVGAVAGFSLGATHARRQPASPSLTSLPVTTRPPAPPATRVVVRRYASPACLETARRGDQLVDLLIRNQRRAAEDLLVLYTVAARQCRKDATPAP
jgi:hypothetical protein